MRILFKEQTDMLLYFLMRGLLIFKLVINNLFTQVDAD